MADLVELQADEKLCRDPECGGIAEPEVDGEHRYWECQDCGFNFAYEKILTPAAEQENCAIGVPEPLRRRMSQGMESAMEEEARKGPTPIALGRKPE